MEFKNLGIVLVTTSSEEEAHAIASGLIEAGLAACINFTPITSVYKWEGELKCNEEWQLIIKTNLDNFSALSTKIKEIHTYQIPEIIALPIIKGSTAYLNWIQNNGQLGQEEK